jgi:hypothetical protein
MLDDDARKNLSEIGSSNRKSPIFPICSAFTLAVKVPATSS